MSTATQATTLNQTGVAHGKQSPEALIPKDSKAYNGSTNNEEDIRLSPNGRETEYGFTERSSAAMTASKRVQVYVLSALEKGSSISQMKSLHAYLKKVAPEEPSTLMQDLAFTLAQRRSLYTWRVAIPASSPAELMERLAAEDLQPSKSSNAPRLAFIFTGQGAQWAAMGRELLRDYPIYASTIREADSCLKRLGAQWSLLGRLD